MEGRRLKRIKRKNIIKNRIKVVILIVILSTIIYICYGVYKEDKIRLEEGKIDYREIQLENKVKELYKSKKIYIIPETYLNYKVSSKLEIPKINLSSNVLEDYNTEAMESCISKYWGPEPNEIGNYCIAGHNYDKDNMFNNLINLEIGDKIYLTDNKNGKYAYTIYDIYKVKPQNIKPLSQNTEGKREITLITCVNYSRNRLIIKAKEI